MKTGKERACLCGVHVCTVCTCKHTQMINVLEVVCTDHRGGTELGTHIWFYFYKIPWADFENKECFELYNRVKHKKIMA